MLTVQEVIRYGIAYGTKVLMYHFIFPKKYNLKVYHISYNLNDIYRKGELKWCPKIEDYLSLIKNAQYVIKDSFHATVFSLIFHMNFVVIYSEQVSSRLRSILRRTNLETCGTDEMPRVELVNNKICFDVVNKKLRLLRKESLSYLKRF